MTSPAAVPRRPRRLLLRTLLVLGSAALALGCGEIALRLLAPAALFAPGRDTIGWTENTPVFDAWMLVDAGIGYVPRLGTDLYDDRGLVRDRPQDPGQPAEGPAVLWLGDSVTARRYIEREVRRQSKAVFRSWCGGVEGYNVAQSAAWYERRLRTLRPAQVVFTLHHNDWVNTPAVFYDDDGRVHCRTFEHDVPSFSPWLFEHCYLYRAVFAWQLQRMTAHTDAHASQKVRAALQQLRDATAADGVPLLVLVLPPMLPEADWSASDRARHAEALAMVAALGIPGIDLLPGLRRAVAERIDPQQVAGDWMHPSEAVARWLAAEIVERGFLPGR